MDKNKLMDLVASQKEQLNRYETRLKDVVAAYKGLLKEKEALEATVSALNKKSDSNQEGNNDSTKEPQPQGDDDAKQQLATIMNSLATLSAEKSRMEMSFQLDKKSMRQELANKDKMLKEMEEKTKQMAKQYEMDLENCKSRIIVERHAREKDTNDQLLMVRELQKLLSDERHLKENLEMQLNDLKAQFSGVHHSDKNMKDLNQELEVLKQKVKQFELNQENQFDNTNMIQQLQVQSEIIMNLKAQHSAALKNEQRRVLMAEEENKKLTLFHEERVANLEARLSELSATVGNYDRIRQQDQESIQKLKERLVESMSSIETQKPNLKSVEEIIEEIQNLKQLLCIENGKLRHPVDISAVFSFKNDHGDCIEDQRKLRLELDYANDKVKELFEESDVQKTHIRNLQEKIRVLNQNIEDQEMELKKKTEEHNTAVKTERGKWKQLVQSMEVDFRAKTGELEQHLQKQRDRSLLLLEEKENEIKTLKTSFEMFIPLDADQSGQGTSSGFSDPPTMANGPDSKSLSLPNPNEQYHILHYVHELARKDVEITALRKAKYGAETSLRQAIKDKITSQEELHDKIQNLEEQVERLERCQSREGANLEYLKNVILSFLITKNVDGKKHMINAIGAVLRFSPTEQNMISNYFNNKK